MAVLMRRAGTRNLKPVISDLRTATMLYAGGPRTLGEAKGNLPDIGLAAVPVNIGVNRRHMVTGGSTK